MNPYEEAAQSMMQAGIGSLSGNTINKSPLFDPRESYIASMHGGNPDQLYDNKINRIISESQAKQDRWEELGGPGYIIENPKGPPHIRFDAFPTFDNKRNKIVPGWMEAGITNPNLKQLAGLDDVWPWMKDKAWPWMKETGEGMKNQIPYLLDNLIPGYEPPEGYYDPDWEENKDMAGMDDSWQYLQKQIDELNPDSPNYEDQLELLQSDMDMKYPWMQMAELTDDQINFMGSPLNTPDFGGMTKEELYNKVKEMEDKGIFGFGAQEPTTIEEFNEMYERMKRGEIGNWVT